MNSADTQHQSISHMHCTHDRVALPGPCKILFMSFLSALRLCSCAVHMPIVGINTPTWGVWTLENQKNPAKSPCTWLHPSCQRQDNVLKWYVEERNQHLLMTISYMTPLTSPPSNSNVSAYSIEGQMTWGRVAPFWNECNEGNAYFKMFTQRRVR